MRRVLAAGLVFATGCSILFAERDHADRRPTSQPTCATGAVAPMLDLILAGLNATSIIVTYDDPAITRGDITARSVIGSIFFISAMAGFTWSTTCKKAVVAWEAQVPVAPAVKPAELDELTRLRSEKAVRDAVDLERLRHEERDRLEAIERAKLVVPAVDAGVPDGEI